MSQPISIELVAEDPAGDAPSIGSVALQSSPDPMRTLRLAIRVADPEGLDALRHARRSILREEWTLGRANGEASLETAVFSPSEIEWTVPASERAGCLEKLGELEARANRLLQDLVRSGA
jgi:hypothetical protein